MLITRYNIPTRFAARAGVNATDPAWLAHREKLFLDFCAPSVARQTVRDFTWMLLVSPGTPERFLAELARHATLVMADEREETIRRLNREIPDDGRPLITSRLDNDDAIAPDYVAKTQRAALSFRRGGRSAVAFTHGVLADIERMRATSLQRFHSPFMSLIETERPFRSVLSYRHVAIDREVPLTAVATAAPMWMQTVHGRNINNQNNWDLIAHDPVDASHFAGRFPGLDGVRPREESSRLRLATLGEARTGRRGGAGRANRKASRKR